MFAQRIGGAVLAALIALGGAAAEAQIVGSRGSTGNLWFAEGNIGAAWGDFDGFKLGGNSIASGDSGDTSFAASVGFGYYFTSQIHARVSYRYFGSFDASGSFAGSPFSLDANAHGLMLGLGFNYDLSRQLFIEATGEIGAAIVHVSATQLSGLALSGNTETSLAGGLGLGLGYRIAPNLDLLLMGNYHWLGDVSASGGGVTARANDLSVLTTTIGARVKF